VKIIVAPDSFKGCLRSLDVADAIKCGLSSVLTDAEIISFPMADGGEGTVEAVIAATGGNLVQTTVYGPLGNPVAARYGIIPGHTAVMEMAAASGIELLSRNELNPMKTSTLGTGQMMLDAIKRGVRQIIIGIGGSATVDGGTGMAQALGFILRNGDGDVIDRPCTGGMLAEIMEIEPGSAAELLANVRIRVACDVTNPLTGHNGAARVYGPQKGADAQMVEILDAGLDSFSQVVMHAGLADDNVHPGDGAAGGLGFGLRTLCGAEMVSGAKLVIETSGLEQCLANADLVITGEGCTDSQTASGKICAVIAETAAVHGVPTIVLSGAIRGPVAPLQKIFAAVMSIAKGPCSLDEAISSAPEWLYDAGRNIGGMLRMK